MAVGWSASVWEVGAGDFEHKGAATSDGLVRAALRVDLRVVIGRVQEESIGAVEVR